MNTAYSTALTEANGELHQLEAQRAELDRRILRLKQTIATLYRLLGDDSPNNIVNQGLTDAMRELLKWGAQAGKGYTAKTAREALEGIGYDFSQYKNALASVNGTLQRLVDQGQARKTKLVNKDGKSVAGYVSNEPKVVKALAEKSS